MIETTNIKLKKYQDGDDPDLTDQYNKSMDILDQKVKANADLASAAKSGADAANEALPGKQDKLTLPLPVTQGGTGGTTVKVARDNINAADKDEFARTMADENAVYPGRKIRDIFPEKIAAGQTEWKILHDLVANRDFSKIRVGDYITVPLTAGENVGAQDIAIDIAGIDHYYNCADQVIPHHLVMVAQPIAVTGPKAVNTSYLQWNTTNDNNGTAEQPHPYLASHLHDWEINDFMPALPEELRGFIVPNRILLEKRYSAEGKLDESTDWAWQTVPVWSMSEMEVYGAPVWGTKGYSVGFDSQFPLFKNTSWRIKRGRITFWLRSVHGGSSTTACNCYSSGTAGHNDTTYDWIRPRPCFLLG